MWQRAWTLLAVLTLLSSMLAWSAVAAKPALANTGPATKLGFTSQPNATYTADDVIDVTVAIQDAGGATVDEGSSSIAEITLSSTNASIEETDLTETAVAGLASFSVHVRGAGTGYTFTATSSGLTDGTSTGFAVTAGALATTVLTPDPATTNADTRDVTFTATGEDAYGNPKGDVTTSVTFAINGDGTCLGSACGSRTTGPYTVSDNTDSGTAALTITPGALDHFTVTTTPTLPATTYVAGASFDVTVTAYDGWGNIKDDYLGGATLSGLADSPGCAVCVPVAAKEPDYGGLTFVNGIAEATATGYLAGSGQKLTASDSGKTGQSAAITILPAALHHFRWDGFGSQQTAGASFDIKATAYDTYGNVKTNYSGTSAALTSTLVSSPNGTPASVGPNLSWTSGVGTKSVYAVKATAFGNPDYATTEYFTITDGSVSKQSGTFGVKPNGLNNLSFASTTQADPTFGGGQPLDTKVSSVIYSACNRAPTGSADPCLTSSAPVKVLARDGFGNRKPGVTVTIASSPAVTPASAFVGTKTGDTADGTGSTPLGEIWFNNLKINVISGLQTDAYQLVASSGAVSQPSRSLRIVSDLAQCTGQSKCFNNTKNNSVSTPENSYSQTRTFNGTFGNVVATTSFSNPALDVNSKCASVRTGATIGSAIDVRVSGENLAAKAPTTTMVMIIPIKTLKFYGISSRNADAFNVCLGALFLDGANTGLKTSADSATPWTSKDKKNKPLASSVAVDADGLWRLWGVPADCGQKYLISTDPCISLKSKSAAAVASKLTTVTGETWTVARVNSELNYADGDIAIFITKPFPWDAKGGGY